MSVSTRASEAKLIRARVADVVPLSFTAAAAYQDLPLFTWLVDDPQVRRAILPACLRLYMQPAITHGAVYTTPDFSALAAWLPGLPAALRRMFMSLSNLDSQLATLTGAWVKRFRGLDTLLCAVEPCASDYVWLGILAVDPLYQHQGLATALLQSRHRYLDRENLAAYTFADEQNRALFQRHGYVDIDPVITLPDGPRLYPMRREPQQPTTQIHGLPPVRVPAAPVPA